MMYTMMQVCRETSMSYQALKFYCNEGLVPNVKRDKNNRRIFDERDVKWIKDLVCLKKCGMSIQEMKDYLALCLQGPSTIPQRKVMLENKQQALRVQIEEFHAYMDYIDRKQEFYDDVLAGKRQQPHPSGRVQKLKKRPFVCRWNIDSGQSLERSACAPFFQITCGSNADGKR